jgi:hypothetical protein
VASKTYQRVVTQEVNAAPLPAAGR